MQVQHLLKKQMSSDTKANMKLTLRLPKIRGPLLRSSYDKDFGLSGSRSGSPRWSFACDSCSQVVALGVHVRNPFHGQFDLTATRNPKLLALSPSLSVLSGEKESMIKSPCYTCITYVYIHICSYTYTEHVLGFRVIFPYSLHTPRKFDSQTSIPMPHPMKP